MALLNRYKKRPDRVTHKDEPMKKANKKEREYWRLMEYIPSEGKYTAYERMEALTVYMVKGSLQKTAEYTGIPYTTIQSWRAKGTWWPLALQELREQKNDQVDSRITGIIDKTLDGMEDRVENGDFVVTKNGDLVRKPCSLKDLAVGGLAVPFDKRALMRGKPTSRTEHTSDKDRVEKLADQFKSISREIVVVDGEFEEINEGDQ